MLELFRLVRIRTIAFAAFTMYAMRYWVILPMLEVNGFTLQLPTWAFTLVVVAVCCLVSGGYVINDYFDTKSDRISGVREVLVGKSVSRRVAIVLHTLLNLAAVVIAFYLGFAVGVWKIGILFLLVSGILWFYSSVYKRYFIVGNLLVALLTSLIPFAALVYEIPLLNIAYADILLQTGTNFVYMFNWMLFFSWFIFLNTWMYEINKDIYTMEGDRENNFQTIPVKLGKKTAGNILTILTVVAMLSAIGIYVYEFLSFRAMLFYLLLAILFPYVLYMFSVQGKLGKRTFQLSVIRLLNVLCVGASMFLKRFFHLIFMD